MKAHIKPTTAKQIERHWHLIDVKGKILGRAATEIALKLMGKSKPYFVRHLDCGDNVVVINSKDITFTGKKEKQKIYDQYSGFPGGRKAKPLGRLLQDKPTEPMRHAIYGMLPKNKLRDRLMTRLFIYPDANHPYASKFEANKS